MREHYVKILKALFLKSLKNTRADLGITQEEMAHRLAMANRTYVYLEHGITSCGALTLALYLIYVCADAQQFLEELRAALDAYDNQAA